MGSTMYAVVEWTHDAQSAAESDPPAVAGPPRWADDHLIGGLFATDKEYDFFAAVAGVRSRFDRPSLFPLRGVPANLSGPAHMLFDYFGPTTAGWLHPSEIERAVAHITDGRFHIGEELRYGLEVMRSMVARFGDAHVRLVFNIM